MNKQNIIERIVKQIRETEPDAEVILYGSYARGEETEESDINVLILLDKDKVTFKDEKRISHPLYNIEFDTGIIISPKIIGKRDWHTRHKITPFYESVMREGLSL